MDGTNKRRKIFDHERDDMSNELQFPIFQLPTNLIYEIISKLPLKTIFNCSGVCRTFRNFIKDPYFAKTHLNGALVTSTTIIVKEHHAPTQNFRPYMLELDYSPKRSTCSSDLHSYHEHIISSQSDGVAQSNVKCCFLKGDATMISSCNGLICLYSPSPKAPTYCICNPVSGECMTLPLPTSPTSDYTYLGYSGFGFCPNTKQYKVIRFMSLAPTLKTVALLHTLGTDSWRNIGDSPQPKSGGSFDCYLDGKLHFITARHKVSAAVYSFDLETEKFKSIPLPASFSPEYIKIISWMNVGVIGKCLCICFTPSNANAYFEVFAMEKYGVQESWVKKFSIRINYYCGLGVQDLHKPIKFLNNGELVFLSKFNSLVSYCPKKRTFRDIKSLGFGMAEAVAHVSSFVSLETDVFKRAINAEKINLQRPMLALDLAPMQSMSVEVGV